MRVIGGKAGGRILKVPKGLDVRPTPDLVKQAVFNSLGERILNARVLELFGGSGALSLESLSRGAASAVCVELSSKHARHIRDNMEATDVGAGRFQIIVDDALKVLNSLAERGELFDLIMADPPYGEKNIGKRSESFAQKLLDHPNLPAVMAAGGLFMLGHTKRDTLEVPAALEEVKMLKHGDSVMRFFRRRA
ncbi:MAG TPA: 16S rRNA (guanine(966)-N(2))-methyltransferase RsmD [Verrucomicrobiae bacterium]|nr:16S rRNA (guanine(966)-N(2))-methyltransferase RsmD [Verrucomicrobiae bacterium]